MSARWRPRRAAARQPAGSRLLRTAPAFTGDFRDTEAVTEVIARVPQPAWDGATYELPAPAASGQDTEPLARLRGQPRYTPPGVHPWPAPPPQLTVVSVTTGERPGAEDRAAARLHAALTYLRLKVAILEAAGHEGRIDDAEHARRRGDTLAARSTVREICREATALLCGGPT